MRRHLLLLVTLFVPFAASAQRSGSSVDAERIFAAIGAREGAALCEIGAGDGELSIAAARAVGPKGHIYTSELGDDRVRKLREEVAASNLPQITVVAGDASRTNFADKSCDAVFVRNVYHHFDDPAAMNGSIAAALKPGGRFAVVDFSPPNEEATRAEDRDKDGMHGVTSSSVERELRDAGFEAVSSEQGARRWFMVVGAKPKQ